MSCSKTPAVTDTYIEPQLTAREKAVPYTLGEIQTHNTLLCITIGGVLLLLSYKAHSSERGEEINSRHGYNNTHTTQEQTPCRVYCTLSVGQRLVLNVIQAHVWLHDTHWDILQDVHDSLCKRQLESCISGHVYFTTSSYSRVC